MTPTGDGFTNPYSDARASLEASRQLPSVQRPPVASIKARLDNAFKGPSGVGVERNYRNLGQKPQVPKYEGPRLRPEPVARPSSNLPSRIPTPSGTTAAAGAAASVATATAAARGFGGKVASQVAGSLGGAAGVGVAAAPIVKGTIDNAFDRAFPDLAPYRKIADNFNPLVPGASSEYSPFNPFSPWYDWAPWNDRKSKNSLNPEASASIENHAIPTGQETNIPFDYPIGQAPFNFKIINTGKVENYGVNFQRIKYLVNTETINEIRNLYGVPESLKIVFFGDWGAMAFLKLRGVNDLATVFNNPGIGPDPDSNLPSRTKISLSIDLKSTDGTKAPWPLTSPLPSPEPLPIPNREIFPQPAPQFDPEGRPEYPRFPQPDTAPQPQRSPSPSPSPQPSPAPQPMPNQPAPIPLPTIDPTAAPTGDPKPRFDPAPAPGPIGRPSPVPNPANKPFPGKQKNPGDYHFEYYDENWRTPDIVKEKQKEQQQTRQNQYQPSPNPNPSSNPQPTPEPNPNPLPAPDFDMCKDPCMADMHDNSKGQKPKKIEYKLFKKCGDNGAEFETKTLDVPANQAEALKILLDDAADRKGEKCTLEANTLTIPEWWAVRPGANRSQMVILYAEVLKTGKLTTSRWQTTIPHYNRPEGAKPSIPSYKKGNVMGTLTLNDNSKIRINASTSSECKKVINKLKILIPVPLRTNNGKAIKPTILEREDGSQKEVNVVPIRGDFYKTGQQSGRPDWSINLRGK